jgi:hypothetical protein
MNLCIILIVAHKEKLSEAEQASLKQCYTILGNYPIKFICPKGLNVAEYKKIQSNVEFEFIDPKWQSTYKMFGRLKVVPLLYDKFKQYRYILFYELDAWVFRDELEYWCNKNYDYIGAPWLEGWNNAKQGAKVIGIGNGGFSLRKVSSHLKALHSFSYIKKTSELVKEYRSGKCSLIELVKNLTICNNTFIVFNNYYLHEDVFWGKIVAGNFKWFHLPIPEEAFKFSVEVLPSQFISDTNTLPFGCHGWNKYEPEFWEKYIQIKI